MDTGGLQTKKNTTGTELGKLGSETNALNQTTITSQRDRFWKEWESCNLKHWTPLESVPDITVAKLEGMKERIGNLIKQPSAKEKAVLVYQLVEFADLFGIKCDIKKLAREYDTSVELPLDLFYEAVMTLKKTWKYGFRMPTPGEINDIGKAKLAHRIKIYTMINLAIQRKNEKRSRK